MTDYSEHKLIIRTEGIAITVAYVRLIRAGQSIAYAVLNSTDRPMPFKFGVVNSMDDFVQIGEYATADEAVMRFALATASFCNGD